MFEQTVGGQSKKIGIDVIQRAQRLRGQELNGDYPGPVFMNQHGAPKHPPLRTVYNPQSLPNHIV